MWTTRDARIGVAEGDVREETGSIPQLVIAPVESRSMTFVWIAAISALHLKLGFHYLNKMKIGIRLYVKPGYCISTCWRSADCCVPKEMLVWVPI